MWSFFESSPAGFILVELVRKNFLFVVLISTRLQLSPTRPVAKYLKNILKKVLVKIRGPPGKFRNNLSEFLNSD